MIAWATRTYERLETRIEAYTERGKAWADQQEAHSRTGVAVSWIGRYREADGQLYALLLAAYFFVTLLPAVLAAATYADDDKDAVAAHLIDRLDLHGATADLARDVLAGTGGHQLMATVIAVASVVGFGRGIGRSLQLVYARAWRMEASLYAITDQLRYVIWLLVFLVVLLGYVVQTALLAGSAAWISWALTPLWIAIVVVVLAWTPTYLLHHRVTFRDALPGALLATAGLGVLRVISSFLFANWLNWYSLYYGGLGIVMAIFFWLVLGATILMVSAALPPAYAERRRARLAGVGGNGGSAGDGEDTPTEGEGDGTAATSR